MFRDTRPNSNAKAAQNKVYYLRELYGELSDYIKLLQLRVLQVRYKTSKNGP